jgi:hypothetical protein
MPADQIYFKLGCRGILVRTCDSFYGMPKGRFLCVAVRTAPENDLLADTLNAVCSAAAGQTTYQSPITNHESPFAPLPSPEERRTA